MRLKTPVAVTLAWALPVYRVRPVLPIVLLLLFLCAPALSAEEDALHRFEQAVVESAQTQSDLERARRVRQAFDRDVSPLLERPGPVDVERARRLFGAAHAAYFYTLADDVLTAMEEAFLHLRRLDGAGKADAALMFDALVGGRRFARARALAGEFGLPPPMRVDAAPAEPVAQPMAIRFLSDRRAAVEQWRQAGVGLVVVVHPGCGFSRRAVEAIGQDPQLVGWIREHGSLLVPQNLTGDLEPIARWAIANDGLPIRLAYRREGFPFFAHWATPTFYVMRDGVVVTRLDGWPDGATTASLRAALRVAGLNLGGDVSMPPVPARAGTR